MIKKINFTKMVASGNDFVVLDNRNKKFTQNALSKIAKRVCQRKMSIGADGLLVIEKAKATDFRMRIFNPDGSEPEMCGNGARCVALYAKKNKIAKNEMTFQTKAGKIAAEVKKDKVKVRMIDPRNIKKSFDIKINKEKISVNFINTGVPHVVLFVRSLSKIDVVGSGRAIRYHKKFMPKGTNADFVKVIGPQRIAIRTYERGVEEETLACGSGACASAIISAVACGVKSPVKVLTRSGEELIIYFSLQDNKVKDVYLEGKAEEVFSGEVEYV